ncbi:hypothetical protein [Andreprevotia chitinilytica]|uniref:hypothetical protein n=1 Tax=Andreprevotia chitinilytica TaxID=396808 RepID=UPI0005523E5C|nr:hypothetical protein [Andreprevotia chitinilytica]
MPNAPQGTPAPPIPRYIPDSGPIGRTAEDFASYGMDCVDELGRLFQILARIVPPGSAAYQLTQTGIFLANERRCAINMARGSAKEFREFKVKEKDRK